MNRHTADIGSHGAGDAGRVSSSRGTADRRQVPMSVMPVGAAVEAMMTSRAGAVGNRALARLLEDGSTPPIRRNGHKGYGTFSPPPTKKPGPVVPTSIESPPSTAPAQFTPTEQMALDAMAKKRRVGKAAEYMEKNPLSGGTYSQLGFSELAETYGKTEPLVEESDALKKWRVKDIEKEGAKLAVGKVVDKATGIPLSGTADTLSTAASSMSGTSLPRPGYEEIPDAPDVEHAMAVISTHLKKSTASKAAKVGGGILGATKGAALGSVVPVVGTIIGGVLGGIGGSKAAEKVVDTASGKGGDRSDVYAAVLTLHARARYDRNASATSTLIGLGLDEETVMSPDGWKAAVEKLGVSGGLS